MPRIMRIGWLIALVLISGQWGRPGPLCADQTDDEVPYYHDYYSKDPKVRYAVNAIEHNHLIHTMKWLKKGDRASMIHEVEFTLRYIPNHPEALAYTHAIAKMRNSVGYPILHYERAIRLFPRYPETYALYGSYLISNEFLEQGIKNLTKAVEIEPNLALAHVWLAKAYNRQGKAEAARAEADKAAALGYMGDLLRDIPERSAR